MQWDILHLSCGGMFLYSVIRPCFEQPPCSFAPQILLDSWVQVGMMDLALPIRALPAPGGDHFSAG